MSLKKKSLAAILATTTLAASVAVVTVNPTASSAASNAENLVKKAEQLSGALKWEISVEYRKTAYPNNVVDYPNMKLFNDTKAALQSAKAAVSKLSGKEKTVLSARLDEVNKYYTRSLNLIDAITAGKKIEKQKVELTNALAKGVDQATVKAYHDLSTAIRKQAIILDRVYGQSTRDLVRDEFKKSAETVIAQSLYPVSTKIELDRLQTGLDKNNDKEVETRVTNAVKFLKKVENAKQKADLASQLNKELELILANSNSPEAVKVAVENYSFDLTAYNKITLDSRKTAIAGDVIVNRGNGFNKAELQKVLNASAAVRTAFEEATQKVKAGNTTVDQFLGGVVTAVDANKASLKTVQGEKTEEFLRGLTSLLDQGFTLTKDETDQINKLLGAKVLEDGKVYKSYKQLSPNGQKAVDEVLNASLDASSFSVLVQAVVMAVLENQLTQ